MSGRWPKRFCCEEDLALLGYDGRDAEKDLRSLRTAGPRAATQELVDVIISHGVAGATIVDVGAGVGAVHLLLLEAGASSAIDVDASREYQAAARDEAARRGLTGRVEYRYGDLVEIAPDLPAADIVTLDSVICCYPYLPAILHAATRPKPRLVGLAYPRDVWWMLAYMHLYNAVHAARRSPSRYFIYRAREVRGLLARAGYGEVYDGGSPEWRVSVYRADLPAPPPSSPGQQLVER